METPNYVGMYANALEAGRSQARRKGVENALAKYKTDPSAAEDELMRYGALDEAGAISQLTERRRQQDVRAQVAPKVQAGDYTGAQADAVAGGNYDLAKQLGGLQEDKLKQLDKTTSVLGGIAHYMAQISDPQERAALWQQTAPRLIEQGMLTPQDAEGVDLSDQGLKSYEAQAIDIKTQIEMTFKERQAQLQDKQFAETKRHNQTTEGVAAKNAATADYRARRAPASRAAVPALPPGFVIEK